MIQYFPQENKILYTPKPLPETFTEQDLTEVYDYIRNGVKEAFQEDCLATPNPRSDFKWAKDTAEHEAYGDCINYQLTEKDKQGLMKRLARLLNNWEELPSDYPEMDRADDPVIVMMKAMLLAWIDECFGTGDLECFTGNGDDELALSLMKRI